MHTLILTDLPPNWGYNSLGIYYGYGIEERGAEMGTKSGGWGVEGGFGGG